MEEINGKLDKSLVSTEHDERRTRYRLLETIRQYSRDRLLESGETDAVRERHRDFYLSLAEEALPQLSGPDQVKWFERLDMEHDNLRAALDLSVSTAGAAESLRLCGALWRFWMTRGYFAEGRTWCARALTRCKGRRGAR